MRTHRLFSSVVVVGTIGMLCPAVALAAAQVPPSAPVTVVNKPSNPVPVTLQGTGTVSGSVSVTNEVSVRDSDNPAFQPVAVSILELLAIRNRDAGVARSPVSWFATPNAAWWIRVPFIATATETASAPWPISCDDSVRSKAPNAGSSEAGSIVVDVPATDPGAIAAAATVLSGVTRTVVLGPTASSASSAPIAAPPAAVGGTVPAATN